MARYLSTGDLHFLCALEEDDEDEAMALIADEEAEVPPRPDFYFSLDSFSDEACFSNFRFGKEDIPRLSSALKLPNPIRLPNGTSVPRTLGMCLLLRRLAYPCRLKDLVSMFGYASSTLGNILNYIVDFIFQNHSLLLNNYDQPWLSLAQIRLFAQKIEAKGAPLTNCWGFIDGTARPICRPSRDQKAMFSGHKRNHVIKFQSVMTPNGLVASLNGPFEGKRHDSGILKESGLLDVLVEKMTSETGEKFCLYGDPAYPLSNHLQCPFKGAVLAPHEEMFNKAMATVRQCVEWGFGKTISLFAFLDYKKNLKLLKQPVGKYYIVGTILTNAHTCLYGSQTGDFFGVDPPSLEEYVDGR